MRNVTFTIGRHLPGQSNVQKVSFFYATTDQKNKEEVAEDSVIEVPLKTEYNSLLSKENVVAAFNYQPSFTEVAQTYSLRSAPTSQTQLVYDSLSWGVTTQGTSWDTLTVLRREIWDDNGKTVGEKYFSPIIVNELVQGGLVDYNVSTDRTYEYIFYPYLAIESQEGKVGWGYKKTVSTKWECWSLTELHPTDDKYTFKASEEDVWLFKYNHTPSSQKQNFVKSEQRNLSAYPRFSQGTQNNISGEVSCLLGSEIACQNFTQFQKRPEVEILESTKNNLIYWASREFFAGSPGEHISSSKQFGIYSTGEDKIVFWCPHSAVNNPVNRVFTNDTKSILQELLFNYYGTFMFPEDDIDSVVNTTNFKKQTSWNDTTWAEFKNSTNFNNYHVWTMQLPTHTKDVPTLNTTATIYYATPGYQLGFPRFDGGANNDFGVYLKHISGSSRLVFWFKKSASIGGTNQEFNNISALQTLFKGGGAFDAFYLNGYFQDSSLRTYRQVKTGGSSGDPSLIDLQSVTSSSNEEWYKVYQDIPQNMRNSYLFFGFNTNPLIKFTKGKQEKVKFKNHFIQRGVDEGGYVEKLPFSERLTSNQKIDMLEAWRKICYSGNPKLLKDNKGQKFLVQITSASNTPSLDTQGRMPEKINFSWVEIGSTKNISVIGERGG